MEWQEFHKKDFTMKKHVLSALYLAAWIGHGAVYGLGVLGLFTVPFLFRDNVVNPAEFTAAWRQHAPGIAVEFSIVGAVFWCLRLPVVTAFGERLKARLASRK